MLSISGVVAGGPEPPARVLLGAPKCMRGTKLLQSYKREYVFFVH